MNKKINYDNLYIVHSVYEHEILTEAWEQYESLGTVEHLIYVNPKKKLIYSKIQEDGNERFYDYKTDEEVFEQSYESSFKTTSSPMKNLYCAYINSHTPMPIREFREEFIKIHERKKRSVGYFIPFKDYIEENYKIGANLLTPTIIEKIIPIMNISIGKTFILSMNPEEAKLQLKKIGYHKNRTKKR